MGLFDEYHKFERIKDTPELQLDLLKNSNTIFSEPKILKQCLIGFSIVNDSKCEIEAQGKTIETEKWEILEYVFNSLPDLDRHHVSSFLNFQKIMQ